MRKHLVDQERSAREGEAVALCGEFLYYVDGAVTVRPEDPASGRAMVFERERECVLCLRRDAERGVSTVTVPVETMAYLASAAPVEWASVTSTLDVTVVNSVNALL